MSCLKRGLLRLPNGKSVRNINDYKLEMYNYATKMSFNRKHVCLIDHILHSKLCYTLTKMTFLISVMTIILLISGVNLVQFSRHKLQPVKLIYYIFIMHMPACQLPQTLLQILFSHQLSNYRGQVTPSQYQSVNLNLVISRFFSITVMKNH